MFTRRDIHLMQCHYQACVRKSSAWSQRRAEYTQLELNMEQNRSVQALKTLRTTSSLNMKVGQATRNRWHDKTAYALSCERVRLFLLGIHRHLAIL